MQGQEAPIKTPPEAYESGGMSYIRQFAPRFWLICNSYQPPTVRNHPARYGNIVIFGIFRNPLTGVFREK